MIIKVQKNVFIAIVVALFMIIGVAVTIVLNPGEGAASQNEIKESSTGLKEVASSSSGSEMKQTVSIGKVEIDVEPKQLGRTETKNIFAIALNTHSVELDFDFTKIIILEDNLGNAYQALEWTGNSGWHHVSGDIIFPPLNKDANEVTLTINEIEGLMRTFNWDVDK
ncbi:hypothetical protein KKB10_01000 [Patescibacteria group bacterium]|nr:hypothetical protein [Patescibacteria group bacterium]MBU1075626.1 hypothetical protein [Patescibacteria group bacterium]MBU1952224.1 hypothetical protein [Patescibacteria group bacterium]